MSQSTPNQGDSYAAQQNFNRLLASENAPSATSSIDAINSLLTLRKALDPKNEGKAEGINKLLMSEVKYLNAASNALTAKTGSGELLRSKFGEGLSAATAFAQILKSRNAQRIGDEIVNTVLEKDASTKMNQNEMYNMAKRQGSVNGL